MAFWYLHHLLVLNIAWICLNHVSLETISLKHLPCPEVQLVGLGGEVAEVGRLRPKQPQTSVAFRIIFPHPLAVTCIHRKAQQPNLGHHPTKLVWHHQLSTMCGEIGLITLVLAVCCRYWQCGKSKAWVQTSASYSMCFNQSKNHSNIGVLKHVLECQMVFAGTRATRQS